MSEYKLHIAIKTHIEKCFMGNTNPGLNFWHVANESRDATQAFWNKKLGILPGVSDLQFGWPISKVGVMELKHEGRLTASQNKFLSWAHHIGWHTGVARSVREAHDILVNWGLKAAYNSVIEADHRSKGEKQRAVFDYFSPVKD